MQKTGLFTNEKKFNEFLVSEYLKYGSVDEVLRKHRFAIPISYAGYQRVLDKWGVVKAAGPNNKLTEALEFLSILARENLPFEKIYKNIPPSFQTSAVSLYRILGYVKEGITRRVGTALVVTPYNLRDKVLIAKDVSTPRIELGKYYGSMSLPMGYSRKRDSRKINIRRVLQQEVFSKKVLEKVFPEEVIPENPVPFMYLDIADVRVSVYYIELPKSLSSARNFSSYKLKDFSFIGVDKITDGKMENLRAGVKEAVAGYRKYLEFLDRKLVVNPLQAKSYLNNLLAVVTIDLD